MQFKQGTSVFTSEDHDVGRIDRVVLDPRTKEVTHVVVRKGLLLTEDKVVPINLIAAATEDRITLREDAGDLQVLPNFEEKHFVNIDEAELGNTARPASEIPTLYWYPPLDVRGPLPDYPRPPYITEIERNIPEGTVALKEGAKVFSADDKRVGSIERILTDPQADRATHFVISQGLLLKERKLVPVRWVNVVGEDEVHLAVGSRLLDELREYHG